MKNLEIYCTFLARNEVGKIEENRKKLILSTAVREISFVRRFSGALMMNQLKSVCLILESLGMKFISFYVLFLHHDKNYFYFKFVEGLN